MENTPECYAKPIGAAVQQKQSRIAIQLERRRIAPVEILEGIRDSKGELAKLIGKAGGPDGSARQYGWSGSAGAHSSEDGRLS